MKYTERVTEKVAKVLINDETVWFINKQIKSFGSIVYANAYVNKFGRYVVQIGECKYITDFDMYTNRKIAELAKHPAPMYFKNI